MRISRPSDPCPVRQHLFIGKCSGERVLCGGGGGGALCGARMDLEILMEEASGMDLSIAGVCIDRHGVEKREGSADQKREAGDLGKRDFVGNSLADPIIGLVFYP